MPTKIATALARGTSREAAAELCREVRSRLEGRAPVLLAAFSSTRQPLGEVFVELGGAALAGFETYGEIALDVGDMSGFHNTTSVVLAFPEG